MSALTSHELAVWQQAALQAELFLAGADDELRAESQAAVDAAFCAQLDAGACLDALLQALDVPLHDEQAIRARNGRLLLVQRVVEGRAHAAPLRAFIDLQAAAETQE